MELQVTVEEVLLVKRIRVTCIDSVYGGIIWNGLCYRIAIKMMTMSLRILARIYLYIIMRDPDCDVLLDLIFSEGVVGLWQLPQ